MEKLKLLPPFSIEITSPAKYWRSKIVLILSVSVLSSPAFLWPPSVTRISLPSQPAQGIPGRPWFRSLYAASDEDSGYAAWILPGLRHAVEHDDEEEFKEMRALYVRVLADLEGRLGEIAAQLN